MSIQNITLLKKEGANTSIVFHLDDPIVMDLDLELYDKQVLSWLSNALFYLGIKFLVGNGVEQNHIRAAHWLNQSAGLGNSTAKLALRKMYSEGDDIEQDEEYWHDELESYLEEEDLYEI